VKVALVGLSEGPGFVKIALKLTLLGLSEGLAASVAFTTNVPFPDLGLTLRYDET
jgi:hypothetical protein